MSGLFPHTKGNEPIPQREKVTFELFCRSVWAMSQTNLAYKDFKVEHEHRLADMFNPVRLPIES